MLVVVQLLCGVLYLVVLFGLILGSVLRGRHSGEEKRVCIREAAHAEQEIFRARRRLRINERLVICLPFEQIFDRELCYIVAHMQQKDPALRVLWIKEKEARAG